MSLVASYPPGTRDFFERLFTGAPHWPRDWADWLERFGQFLMANEKDGSLLVWIPGGKY